MPWKITEETMSSYSPIWKDIEYTSTANTLDYALRDEHYNAVHTGYATRMPDQTGITINVNNRLEEYLKPDFDSDIKDVEDDVVPNGNAYREYRLQVPGAILETYGLLYDWSYEDRWSGQSEYMMSQPINGHLDPRMKVLAGMYNTGETDIEWDVEYRGVFDMQTTNLTFGVPGSSEEVEFITNMNWEITSKPAWVSVDTSAGTASFTSSTPVTITVTANAWTGDTSREGEIVFTHSEGTHSLNVKQYGIYLDVEPTSLTYPVSGGSRDITVRYNYTYGVTSPAWITIGGDAPTTGTGMDTIYTGNVTASASTGVETGRTGVIAFTQGEVEKDVAVTQTGHSLNVSPLSLSYVSTGGSATISIESDAEWSISAPDWITPGQVSGSGDTQVVLSAAENSGDRRTGTVVVSSGMLARNVSVEQDASAYAGQYLTLNILSSGTITWTTGLFGTKTIQRSINNGPWVSFASTNGTGTTIANVVIGDNVRLKGDGPSKGCKLRTADGAVLTASGNIMSLLYGDDFGGKTELPDDINIFRSLFSGNTGIISAEHIILPSMELRQLCYAGMFRNCTNLTTGPALPATTVAQQCYSEMFYGCTSLTITPELPATEMAASCYDSMFAYCSNLTTAPNLPATTLAYGCYTAMFSNTIITESPELPATVLAEYCYTNMFSSTRISEAPTLPASVLPQGCYSRMFLNCTNLNRIECLATDISANYCLANWVNGVSSTGTFVKAASMSDWTTGADGIPEGWTVVDAQG